MEVYSYALLCVPASDMNGRVQHCTVPHFVNYTVVEGRAACVTEEEHVKNQDGQEDGAMVKDAMLL